MPDLIRGIHGGVRHPRVAAGGYPAGAHAVAVSASLRLRCDARPGVGVAQLTARPEAAPFKQVRRVSSRSAQARPPPGRASQPPQKRPRRVPACREETGWSATVERQPCLCKSCPGGRGASCELSSLDFGSTRRASWMPDQVRHVSLRSSLRARSELCDGPRNQANPGESVRSTDRLADAPRPARTRLCRVPPAFLSSLRTPSGQPVRHLAPGLTMAWHARLSLELRLEAGRCVARFEHEGPLRILQTLYPEGDAISHNVLVHPPSGLVGGDTLDLDVHAGAGRAWAGDDTGGVALLPLARRARGAAHPHRAGGRRALRVAAAGGDLLQRLHGAEPCHAGPCAWGRVDRLGRRGPRPARSTTALRAGQPAAASGIARCLAGARPDRGVRRAAHEWSAGPGRPALHRHVVPGGWTATSAAPAATRHWSWRAKSSRLTR